MKALFILGILLFATSATAQELPPHPRQDEIFARLQSAGVGLWSYKVYDPAVISQICAEVGAGHIKLRAFADGRRAIQPARLAKLINKLSPLKVEVWCHTRGRTLDADLDYLANFYQQVEDQDNFVGLMLNIEHNISARQAGYLVSQLASYRDRHAAGSLIGFSSYPVIDLHSDKVPFDTIVGEVDYVAPQVYWAHNGSGPKEYLDRSYQTWLRQGKRLGFDPIIAPVGQTYSSEGRQSLRPGQLTEFIEATKGYKAISFYSIDELKEKQWAIDEVARAIREYRPQDIPGSAGQSNATTPVLERVWTLVLWLVGAYLLVAFLVFSARLRQKGASWLTIATALKWPKWLRKMKR
ncbi:MAG: hypothetical protein Q8Q05_00700 [bacterium]|nr:hypothetical protein [bacterium]